MKTTKFINGIVGILTTSSSLLAQDNNLVLNGSLENTCGKTHSYGAICLADSVSSSNNTTVDLFSKNTCSREFSVPNNYMGTQDSKSGNNYAGIIAYYADDAGFFNITPGYRKYSEYIQFKLREPLIAGKSYNVSFNVSLAESSAYAVSGLGFYVSKTKVDVKNNAFLPVTPYAISTEIVTNKEWSTIVSTYVATGGESEITIGCFDKYMETEKIIAENTNNNRKAYYYIDDVTMTPQTIDKTDMASILSGSCYQLNNLTFQTDQSVILSESYTELKQLSRFLRTYPYIVVYIDGYTDQTGTDKHNDKLSEERANAVKAYLTKEHVDANRLKVRAHGENFPIDNQNSNSAVNRRVEITICAN
ncbi:MAG: OmpA family protein [Bacteroidetes bacterium]|nr:OmpA family protein [Bacteroidota bacterium]